MANKLCCILNAFLKCEVCEGVWCHHCWDPKNRGQNGHPTLQGGGYYKNGLFHRMCLNTPVEYTGAGDPIVFRKKRKVDILPKKEIK